MKQETLSNEIREKIRKVSGGVIRQSTEDVIVRIGEILSRYFIQKINSEFERIIPIMMQEIEYKLKSEIKDELKEVISQEVKIQMEKALKPEKIRGENEVIQDEAMNNLNQ